LYTVYFADTAGLGLQNASSHHFPFTSRPKLFIVGY